ncbi:hypothetical protein ES288_A12G052700v1 [Gossypium darwinii]|uniref:RING-type E3 ubiquitin transferase n=1 Tax=Gossypium darwinii TaxID=34276 RepID=A0A5D2E6D4_GOSDA|nr:hypothetical protein ES288_A12G052700v1 [Gossypium darwinii]
MAQTSPSPSADTPTSSIPCQETQEPTVDLNLMIIVAAMLCALGLHPMLQCVLQCTHRVVTEPREWVAARRLNSDLKKKEMVALPTTTYANSGSSSSSSSSGCAICLVDFSEGDKIRMLPKCNHRFHVACIDKWLLSRSSCPTCRQRLNSNGDQFVTDF